MIGNIIVVSSQFSSYSLVDTLSIRLRTYLMVPIKESFLGAADDDVRPCYNEVVHLHPLQGRAKWMMVVTTSVSGEKSYPSCGLPFLLEQEHGRRAKAAHPVELWLSSLAI